MVVVLLLLLANLLATNCHCCPWMISFSSTSAPFCSVVLLQYILGGGIYLLVLCVQYIPYLTVIGPLRSFSAQAFRVLLLSLLNLSPDPCGVPPVYSAKQKFVTICWSKWSYAVTQMSQTEIRWCMRCYSCTGQCGRCNGCGAIQLAHSGSFSGCRVMPNDTAYVNIAAWFIHWLPSCITKGMIGT